MPVSLKNGEELRYLENLKKKIALVIKNKYLHGANLSFGCLQFRHTEYFGNSFLIFLRVFFSFCFLSVSFPFPKKKKIIFLKDFDRKKLQIQLRIP